MIAELERVVIVEDLPEYHSAERNPTRVDDGASPDILIICRSAFVI
jgi:hypothetical protein